MENKKKILICGILPPPNFGHSMMYQMLMNSEFVDEFDVIFLNMNFWSYGKHKKVTIEKLFKFVKFYFQFIYFVLLKRPDCVLYNMSFYKMPFLKDFLFCMTGKLFGVPFVVHDMGQYLKELYENSSWLGKKFVKFYAKQARASIIMGENVRIVYEGFMPQEKLFVVPGCVEDTKDIDVPRWEREKDEIRVLYFSFMSESKGIYTAFNVVPKIVEQNKNVKFIFAGPIESEQVREHADDLMKRFPKNVTYLGYIEDEKRRTECFRNSDIFIFPTNRDVFGLVLLHAMAENCAIIASNEGTIPEIILDQETGLIIEKGNIDEFSKELNCLIGDKEKRQKLAMAARNRFNEFYAKRSFGDLMKKVCHKI